MTDLYHTPWYLVFPIEAVALLIKGGVWRYVLPLSLALIAAAFWLGASWYVALIPLWLALALAAWAVVVALVADPFMR